jgi:uncharacterized protein YdaU (DUF1376 family)
MAEKVDAWMPLHVGAYVAATGHLSVHEHGMYLLLLMHAWVNGGAIPGEDDRIRRVCRAGPKEWVKSRAAILDFWDRQPDGTYRQKRLDAELSRAADSKVARSEAGKIGAANRWQRHSEPNGKSMAKPMANAMPSQWPIPEPVVLTTTPSTDGSSAPAASGGGEVEGETQPPSMDAETRAHALAAVCAVHRIQSAVFSSDVVKGWVRDGVTDAQLAQAITEARRSKPVGERLGVNYLVPIVARILKGGGKPVDSLWRASEPQAVAKGRELGIQPRVGEDMASFVRRVDTALAERARSQVQ